MFDYFPQVITTLSTTTLTSFYILALITFKAASNLLMLMLAGWTHEKCEDSPCFDMHDLLHKQHLYIPVSAT